MIAVREGVIYYGSHGGVGALDLATGRRKWSSLGTQRIAAATIRGGALYAICQGEKTSVLVAIDLGSRKSRTLARLATGTEHLAMDSRYLYVLDQAATLRAYNPGSGAVIWSRPLPHEKPRGVFAGTSLSAQLATTRDGVYVGLDDFGAPGRAPSRGEFAVDPEDGRILWHNRLQFPGQQPPIVIGSDVIVQQYGLRRINVRSGQVAWNAEGWYSDAVLVANVVVSTGQNEVLGRDVSDGRLLWRLPLRSSYAPYRGGEATPAISDGESAWVLQEPVVCVTKDGRVKWNRSEAFTGKAAYADGEWAVTTDDERILGYGAGTLPPLPTSDPERRLLAGRLAAQFEILDNAERRQLEKLVPFSFRPLLARYVDWANACGASPDLENRRPFYRLIRALEPLLQATYRKEDTGAILTAWSGLGVKSRQRNGLERILQEKGDPASYLPALAKRLRSVPPAERVESVALTLLSHSSHPEAVALMIETLRDPKATEVWRQEAFRHLAGTGGTTGVQAVREARPRRAPRKPWFDRIDVSKLGRDAKLGTRTDARGRTWMLFRSEVLGNDGDLFVVQKLGSTWGKPLFTGTWTAPYMDSPAPRSVPGVPTAKLQSTEWIRIFPDDAAIRRDSDGDGLTDLVESRLGTASQDADMDGEGFVDAIDPCPNAAPRPLGDTEKIIAAAVEAWFCLHDWRVPAILTVKGVAPFELYGYAPTVVWEIVPGTSLLRNVYRGGVNVIGFYPPGKLPRPGRPIIEYSADHKTARTIIDRISGGLSEEAIEVTLRKFGEDWFAVGIEGRWSA